MKALLVIGILLMIGSVALASAKSRPMTGLSKTGDNVVSLSMTIGLVLVIISAVLYLRK